MKKIILASGSPRRRELLEQIGIHFEVQVSAKEECYESVKPDEIVMELALMKAENVYEEKIESHQKNKKDYMEEMFVIGADTVVVLDGEILGKPQNEADAFAMLFNLQGRAHQVYTGIAILDCDQEGNYSIWKKAVETKVYVTAMREDEIWQYIDSGEPMDKAGAYGIQGRFGAFVERIDGDYYNVVGLPISIVYQHLKKRE